MGGVFIILISYIHNIHNKPPTHLPTTPNWLILTGIDVIISAVLHLLLTTSPTKRVARTWYTSLRTKLTHSLDDSSREITVHTYNGGCSDHILVLRNLQKTTRRKTSTTNFSRLEISKTASYSQVGGKSYHVTYNKQGVVTIQLYCFCVEKFAFWLNIYINHSIHFTIKQQQFNKTELKTTQYKSKILNNNNVCTHTCIQACTHTHTCTYTCMNTHTHTHTHTHYSSGSPIT